MRPTKRMLIEPVAEDLLERRARRRVGDPLGVDGDRQHAGRREAERLELLPVELRIAEREVDAADQRRELARGRARPAGTARRRRARRSAPA